MPKVNDIVQFMESIAPQSKKESWDNVGLLCGRKEKEVKTILIALDPFQAVADEAVQLGADMIVTHHPLIFRPLYEVTDGTSVGRTVATLLRNDISAFCAHTNLDIAPGGVGICLAEALELDDITPLHPQLDEDGNAWALLRKGTVERQSLTDFLAHIKRTLGTPVLRYADGGNPVHHVAVGGGACANEWRQALEAGCDTFVTADAKYNDFWDARDAGLTLIDAGHFYTENPVCTYLQKTLKAAFPEIHVLLSSVHRDCMAFF